MKVKRAVFQFSKISIFISVYYCFVEEKKLLRVQLHLFLLIQRFP